MDLFEQGNESRPLAARMRPESLEDLIGQEEILGPGRLLRRAIKSDQLTSLIFYGPPGTGKTTLAKIIANTTKSHFISLNAVLSGIKQVKEAMDKAQDLQKFQGKKTLLFVDEVHRWNKAQQDALLPWVENGTIILIGATTENPFFEVNSALVSRSRIFQLKPLTEENLMEVAQRAITDPVRGYGQWKVEFDEAALAHLVKVSDGDARTLLNAIQLAVETTPETFPPPSGTSIHITLDTAEQSIQKRVVLYDRDGDYHFDTISAFIKSLRGSDPDAALYWLAVMVKAGEDPAFIFRRMLISASEDIGLADPQALVVVNAASEAFERTGFPEGNFFLTQAALYLATAPKSNSSLGFFDAMKAVEKEGGVSVPVHLKDANRDGPLGHGAGYQYPHSFRNHWVNQQYLPTKLRERVFYHPGPEGHEAVIRDQVLSRRECQLSAVLTDSDEEMTFGAANGGRKGWIQRSESGLPAFLRSIREQCFEGIPLKRNSRILVLEETAGLLALEACRRAPEGGTWFTLKKGISSELIESLTSGWPEIEKPQKASGLSILEQIDNFQNEGINFDFITGILSNSENLEDSFQLTQKLIKADGHFTLLCPLPGKGTRPGQIVPEELMDSSHRSLYDEWEKFAYEADSIKDPLNVIKDYSYLEILTTKELSSEETFVLSAERLNKWFPEDPKESRIWSKVTDHTNPLYASLRKLFLSQLNDKKVSWVKKFLLMHGIMKIK